MKREDLILAPNIEVLSDYYKKIDYWYQMDINIKGSTRILNVENHFLN